ncbi:hypothetical protein BpHYR1_035570 [Brachionus plicatilis]|uniref:Uncharacterized protein n=1 Tax=Brachionus plicatilis TaxID=10195 RepID=A0A3M7PDR5_BRAPC|nr:hypothetical protein BpHYR1_035570 [Brachionus plicatilis]
MSSTESVIPNFNEEDTMLDIDQEDVEPLKNVGKEFYIKRHDTNLWKYQYKRKRIDTVCYYFLCSPPLSSCSTMAYYHLTSDDEVCLFISDYKHEHKDKTERGIPTEIKEQIKRYFEMKITTPKAILRALDHDGLQQPQIKTLSNYLAIIRKDNYGPAHINVRDLELWHQNRKEVPDHYDKPFCPSFENSVDNDQLMFFRIFITTKRLISNADKTKH